MRARRGCAVYYPDASAYALHHHSTFASGGRLFYMNSFRVCVIVCIRCRPVCLLPSNGSMLQLPRDRLGTN